MAETIVVCHQEQDASAKQLSSELIELLRVKFSEQKIVALAMPSQKGGHNWEQPPRPYLSPSVVIAVVGRYMRPPPSDPREENYAPTLPHNYDNHSALRQYILAQRAPVIIVDLDANTLGLLGSSPIHVGSHADLDKVIEAVGRILRPVRSNLIITASIAAGALVAAGIALVALPFGWMPDSLSEAMGRRPQLDCEKRGLCTPVTVFFGTNRNQITLDDRADFGDARRDLNLGQAIVTVPRNRKVGRVQRPTYWDILSLKNPFREDQARHFTIPANGVLIHKTRTELFAAVSEHIRSLNEFRDQAFVFVHGYNTSFDAGLYRAAQLTYDLGNDAPFGTAFLFSWPSGGASLDYVYDLESARFAIPHLRTFLNHVLSHKEFKNVHLIAHSMGNFPLLKVIEEMAKTEELRIGQIILAAPDVDAIEFSEIAKNIVGKARGITLYASSNDRAILFSRVTRKDTPRAGDVMADGPVVIEGIDTLDASVLSTDFLAWNHSDYAERKELLNDIHRLLLSGERPPSKRNINWKPGIKANLPYWRFAD